MTIFKKILVFIILSVKYRKNKFVQTMRLVSILVLKTSYSRKFR